VIETDQEEELRNYTSLPIINNPNIFYFFLGGGVVGDIELLFSMSRGNQRLQKLINTIRQRKLNLCRADRAGSSRPRPRPGHGKRGVRFDWLEPRPRPRTYWPAESPQITIFGFRARHSLTHQHGPGSSIKEPTTKRYNRSNLSPIKRPR